MGKIRVKTLGLEDQEAKQKEEARQKRAAKKLAKTTAKNNQELTTDRQNVEENAGQKTDSVLEDKKSAAKVVKNAKRSKKYQEKIKQLEPDKVYSLADALDILTKVHLARFDETVELHLNSLEKTLSGSMVLPHGTGKKLRVLIADDNLIAEIEKGNLNFDILLASPLMMPKLAKVARVLGPKGLMPNPKNGTVSTNPEETAKKYQSGHVNFKTEAKMPLLHLSVGKLSFGKDKLQENIKTAFKAVETQKIKKAVLKSTMSPGIKLDLKTV